MLPQQFFDFLTDYYFMTLPIFFTVNRSSFILALTMTKRYDQNNRQLQRFNSDSALEPTSDSLKINSRIVSRLTAAKVQSVNPLFLIFRRIRDRI